jgi:hypothetical protein
MRIGGLGYFDPLNAVNAPKIRINEELSSTDRINEIDGNDIQQAFKDIEKDKSLAQYQYFVGGNPVIDSSDDGIVIQKSGFGQGFGPQSET